jgi:hypothetical protein
VHFGASAEIKLLQDWGKPYPDGSLLPTAYSDKETALFKSAQWLSIRQRIATPLDSNGKSTQMNFPSGFRMHFDQDLYYFGPVGFMHKSRPEEVCTEQDWTNRPTYRCIEGQRYTRACHIGIYDRHFHEVAWHKIRINRDFPLFCNSVVAVGRLDAMHNEVLAVVQYFRVDDDAGIATSRSQIGSGWHRMTVRLKLKRIAEGRIDIQQDDTCLGNPNSTEEIAEARQLVRRCELRSGR